MDRTFSLRCYLTAVVIQKNFEFGLDYEYRPFEKTNGGGFHERTKDAPGTDTDKEGYETSGGTLLV